MIELTHARLSLYSGYLQADISVLRSGYTEWIQGSKLDVSELR